jgi:16S rRNA (cytidine1402-2'-O)-methyltransferase
LLYFIATPIGNLEDISIRSLRLLSAIKLIFCEDTRVTKKLIKLLQERFKEFDFTPKEYISLHEHNQKRVISNIDLDIFKEDVAYLSDAGMPAISDPGCELVRFCQNNSIEYEVLPGANAATLSFASSGFCHKEFLFFGFLPHKGRDRKEALDKALNSGYATILYEAPHRIEKLINEIASKDPQRELYLIKEATKLHQTSFKNSAEKLKDILKNSNTKGEWTVVIESKKISFNNITSEDIISLNIPKKEAAKLLSKITGKPTKTCYNELLQK